MILAHNFGDIGLYSVVHYLWAGMEGWHMVHRREKLFMVENKKNEEGVGSPVRAHTQ